MVNTKFYSLHTNGSSSSKRSLFLVGQTITQANNPADDDINKATAIVENVTKFQEGSVEIIEVEINPETTTRNFCNWPDR